MIATATKEILGEEGCLSVIMPAYNLGGCIYDNILATAAELASIRFEVVVVDDGSSDHNLL